MDLLQHTANHTGRYQDLHLLVDFEREAAYLDGKPLKLTYKAFCLLAFLIRYPSQLVPRETLLRQVWGYGQEIRTRTLDVHIRRLRKSMGEYGQTYIETIFGVGYRFQPCRVHVQHETPAPAVMTLGATAPASGWRWKMEGVPAN